MSQYFPKLYEPFVGDINVKVDLSSYATKADLKDLSHVDVTHDLAKLSNLVKNSNNIDTTGFVLKTTYDTEKSELEKKISDENKKNP